MGDATRKLNRRQEFLTVHPLCVYCMAPATTSDHCPPRCFFSGRHWPESYEFPACEPCNAASRLDEQALAVLLRVRLRESDPSDQLEWKRLVQGVRNNQPELIAEWTSPTRNEIKHGLRRTFGSDGDLLRHAGWGLANIGPLSKAMVIRFMIKLAKALYYKHNSEIFDGAIYIRHIGIVERNTMPEFVKNVMSMAPVLADIKRNQKSLSEQFIYRLNYSPEPGAMYAVVQFGDQFIFQLMALSRKAEKGLIEFRGGVALSNVVRHECFLK